MKKKHLVVALILFILAATFLHWRRQQELTLTLKTIENENILKENMRLHEEMEGLIADIESNEAEIRALELESEEIKQENILIDTHLSGYEKELKVIDDILLRDATEERHALDIVHDQANIYYREYLAASDIQIRDLLKTVGRFLNVKNIHVKTEDNYSSILFPLQASSRLRSLRINVSQLLDKTYVNLIEYNGAYDPTDLYGNVHILLHVPVKVDDSFVIDTFMNPNPGNRYGHHLMLTIKPYTDYFYEKYLGEAPKILENPTIQPSINPYGKHSWKITFDQSLEIPEEALAVYLEFLAMNIFNGQKYTEYPWYGHHVTFYKGDRLLAEYQIDDFKDLY